MSTHASIWTPRHTHKLWPRPKQGKVFKAQPYTPPPPPPPLKKPPPPEEEHTSAEELEAIAADLLREADSLNTKQSTPSARLQLGMYLLDKDDAIKSVLKQWDQKGKGEFLKGEFRLNLRATGITATSGEADELFDSWDDDKGGSLDLKELKRALVGLQDEARKFRSTPDPGQAKARDLRKRAAVATEAARFTAQAQEIEDELHDLIQQQGVWPLSLELFSSSSSTSPVLALR